MREQIDKPIIFIGTGRSGTTLISEIIMRHPALAYPSNYNDKFYKYPIIGIIRFLFINNFYKIYGQKKQLNEVNPISRFSFKPDENYKMWSYLTGKQIDFSRNFLLNTDIPGERMDFIRNYFIKLIKWQGKKLLAFKITGPSRISFLQQIFPDARFVYLKRKPVPIISSFYKVKFWETRGKNKLHWLGAYTDGEISEIENVKKNSIYMTTIQIKKLIDMHQYEVGNCKPNIIEVSYEDFVKNPEKSIHTILDFANLKKDSELCFKYLNTLKIYNCNKKDEEYFTEQELKTIYGVLKL